MWECSYFFLRHKAEIIKLPNLRGIKQCKSMVELRGFPLIVHCLGRWLCSDLSVKVVDQQVEKKNPLNMELLIKNSGW